MFERETAEAKKKKEEEKEETLVIQSDEATARMGMGLLKTPDPDLMSELNSDQHRALVALATRASKYDLNVLQTYLEQWLKLHVSLDRKGRKEIHSMVTAIRTEEASRSKFERLKGVLGLGEEY